MIPLNSFAVQYLLILIASILISKLFGFSCIISFLGTFASFLWISWSLTKILRRNLEKQRIRPKGKAILITGCDSGFGHQTAIKMNSFGIKVYAICLNANGSGAQALDKLKIQVIEMDVTKVEDIKHTKNIIEKCLKDNNQQLWAIVNNAGLIITGEVEWGSMDSIRKVFDVNVFGMVQVIRHFLPLIRKSKGRVINIASYAGRFSSSGLGYYSMTKHAVVSLSDALRREMNKWNVKVITIEPEAYKTPMSVEENLIQNLNKIWEETDQEVKSDYGTNYLYAFRERILKISKIARSHSNEVTDAIFDAITDLNPQVRYKCCGPFTTTLWWMFEHLPQDVMDRVVSILNVGGVKPRALDNY